MTKKWGHTFIIRFVDCPVGWCTLVATLQYMRDKQHVLAPGQAKAIYDGEVYLRQQNLPTRKYTGKTLECCWRQDRYKLGEDTLTTKEGVNDE